MVVVTTLGPPELPPPMVRVTTFEVETPVTDAEMKVDGLPVATAAVSEVVNVEPGMLPEAAAEITLEEIDAAAVIGQVVVVSTIVSVTRMVRKSSVGSVERAVESAGQFVMVAAHEIMVRTDVVRTVRVVSPPEVPFLTGPSTPVGLPVPEATLEPAVIVAVELWR